jgi:hypothetical protein
MWRSSITRFEVGVDKILIEATNDYGTRRFGFLYAGVKKLQTTSARLYYMPTIVVQELVKLRGGVYRHTFSDMGGAFTTIHAATVTFSEDIVQ